MCLIVLDHIFVDSWLNSDIWWNYNLYRGDIRMTEIKSLDDVMFHFRWIFIAFIVLFIIVCVNFIKALYINKYMKQGEAKGKIIQFVDLGIDVLCGIAMYAGLLFHGVLADNNAVNWNVWSNRLVVISIVSFVIFILNIIVIFNKREK